MKYKILIAATILLVYLGNSSCQKFLDIQPQFKFVDTLALSTLSGLTSTTVGAFNTLQSSNLYGGGIIAYSELMSDFLDTVTISDYSQNQLKTHQMDPTNGIANGMWNDGYHAILIANIVLANLPKFYKQDSVLVKHLQGECYFIRGIMHYELVRMFAQPSGFTSDDSHPGIPIITSPGSLTANQATPRSTVAQVYQQIAADLTTANKLLPTTTNPGQALFAVKSAAQGFLVKAYFTQNNFAQAKAWADSVINTSGLRLNTYVTTIDSASGNSGTPETVFQEVNIAPSDVSNGPLTSNFTVAEFTAPYGALSKSFRVYLSNDSALGGTRYSKLYKSIRGNYFTRKYQYSIMNVTVIRLAEILLDRAECNAQLHADDNTVRKDWNAVRTRAGLLADDNTTGQQTLINAIRAERDYELAFEGDRFFELKRRKQDFNTPTGYFAWNSNQLVYPIPLQEVQNNPKMVQNSGY